MLAVGALGSLADKERVASMASSTHSLFVLLQAQVLPSLARSDRQRLLFRAGIHRNRFPFIFGFLLTLRRVSRTFLASPMLAIAANFVGTIGGLATMTGAVNPEADFLLHPFGIALRRSGPVAGA